MIFNGMKDMGNLMKQAQEMKSQIKAIHEELKSTQIEGSSKKGLAKVIVTGELEVTNVIYDESIKNEPIDKIADLTKDAVNDALKKAKEISAKKLSKVTGGFNIPGLS